MVKNSSEYWEKRIAKNTWKTYNSIEEKNRELLDFYIGASENVKQELYSLAEKYSRDGVLTLSEMHKQNRLKELNKKYEDIALELGKKVEEAATGNMQDGFKEAYKNAAVTADDFSMPNKKLMDKLLNEPWRGDSFSGRLWKNQKRLASGLNNMLLAGLQQGKTVTEIAVNLHNLMGNGFNDCHRLVRTETMHYLNSATEQRYKDDGVEKVQVWAAEDERTCDSCGKEHEKIYPINRCPVLPFHPNCRCTILPVIEEDIKYSKTKSVMSREYSERARNIRTPEDLNKVSKSSIIEMENHEDISQYFHDKYSIKVFGFEKKDLFSCKASLAGVDDFLNEFPDANNKIKDIRYNSKLKSCGRMYSKGLMEIGAAGLKDYGTGVHESAHALDFEISKYGTNSFSENIVEQARKNLKLRINSKEYRNLRIMLTGRVDDSEKLWEVFAYAIESELGGSSNKLSREIYNLLKNGGI